MFRRLAIIVALGTGLSCDGNLIDRDGVQELGQADSGSSDAGAGGPDAGLLSCIADDPCRNCTECKNTNECAPNFTCQPAKSKGTPCGINACLGPEA
jgi:hypothetical protein